MALTGGIGSGKSTVAAMFIELGVPVLDLDKIGRACLKNNFICKQLVACFGRYILADDGGIHRKRLAAKAFSNAHTTQQLNHILHPAIVEKESRWLAKQHAPYAIIEASVLLESAGESRMDAVIVVLADLELRRTRVLQRADQDEVMFERIVKQQCDDALRRRKADYILKNDGERRALDQQVIALYQQWMNDYG